MIVVVAAEVTVPILPCGAIDEIGDSYRMLGFAVNSVSSDVLHVAAMSFGGLISHE